MMAIRGMWVLLAGGLLAGCQGESFRSRMLGEVNYDEAFRAGQAVFAGYFTVESVDAPSGQLTARPRLAAARPGLISTGPAARELAVLRIRQKGPAVWADVRVQTQRQESASLRGFSQLSSQQDVPNQSPAQTDAAISNEQSQAWQEAGFNYELERRILDDIFNRLHPEGTSTSGPATAPAAGN